MGRTDSSSNDEKGPDQQQHPQVNYAYTSQPPPPPQVPYYPPSAQTYPQPAGHPPPSTYVPTPTYPPAGYPQAAPQPQIIIVNQVPSGPSRQVQQEEEVVAVSCLEACLAALCFCFVWNR